MRRAGIAAGSSILLAVALAVGPSATSEATRATDAPARVTDRAAGQRPAVSRLAPASASVRGGVDVVVTGRHLSGVTQVLFGSERAKKIRVKSANKLVVRAPAHAAGTVAVQVLTRNGRSATGRAARFTYLAPP